MARIIRDSLLNQNAYRNIDNFTDANKLILFVKLILLIDQEGRSLIDQGLLFEQNSIGEVISILKNINISITNEDYNKIIEMKDSVIEECVKLMFPLYKSKI
jgi:vacuolar-type H+-ATPase catalytic subunit A/Vma1